MINEVEQGKEDLKKMPSLRLKCWNATRWLGRSTCLMALCKAYECVLEHLSGFASETTELSSHRKTAADLYENSEIVDG
jgi:hypothetical protein